MDVLEGVRLVTVPRLWDKNRSVPGQRLSIEEWLYRIEHGKIEVNSDAYAFFLRKCDNAKALFLGRRIHTHVSAGNYKTNLYLGNLILQMYGKCGGLADAIQCFDGMCQRNVFSWTIMLLNYARFGNLENARDIFDRMPERDLVAWNTMIKVYEEHGHGLEAFHLFHRMQFEGFVPNKVTIVILLSVCSNQLNLAEAKRVHGCILNNLFQSNVVVATALFTVYGKCGNLEDAQAVFDQIQKPNLVSWNSLIGIYAEFQEACKVFISYQQVRDHKLLPNRITFLNVLPGFVCHDHFPQGKYIHADILIFKLHTDMAIGTTLINMYGKCGSIEDGMSVFQKLNNKGVSSWNALIAIHAHHGDSQEAYQLFYQMQVQLLAPDQITYSVILNACANEAALLQGKQIHSCIENSGLELDTIVYLALINMYSKCGKPEDAHAVFNEMHDRQLVPWTSLISAYARQGRGNEAFALFQKMQLDGVIPNQLTFSTILSACSHGGLVDNGCHLFLSMNKEFGFAHTVEHHHCIIDLLGRAGLMDKSACLINSIPFQFNEMSWMSHGEKCSGCDSMF